MQINMVVVEGYPCLMCCDPLAHLMMWKEVTRLMIVIAGMLTFSALLAVLYKAFGAVDTDGE
jgi:hypothetical protein